MDPQEFGDIADLRIRLQVMAEEADRRLVTVFGSGISSAVLPGVPGLTQIFRDHIPERGRARFDETIASAADPGLKYQNAAALLTKQAGEAVVMRAIRSAVLQACRDVPDGRVTEVARDAEQCRRYMQSGNWNVPVGYQRFARFFAALQGNVRGPIITTNFDPLIEIALRDVGIAALPVPVPADLALTREQLLETTDQPVFHIHGYWTGPATSNVPSRITANRPRLDYMLQEFLRNSVVLVVGYSGWLDGFMKSLRSRVLNDADLLQVEVLWAAYESNVMLLAGSGALYELVGAPGFSLYLGVDGHELFTDELDRDDVAVVEGSSPFGYSRVSPTMEIPASYAPAAFVAGMQPAWADAEPGRWPVLSSTVNLEQSVLGLMDAGGGGGAVALGPLGEGKSLAIRQVARSVAEARPEWKVLWREPGAPAITESWLHDVRAIGPTLICADDADLMVDSIVATESTWSAGNSRIVFLLASHDRLWWQGAGQYLRPWFDDVLFHGITRDDAENIAQSWQELGLLPSTLPSVDDVAEQLVSSADVMAAESNTLFGAVLDVRHGAGLSGRVEDLVRKLHETKLTDYVNLGDVFAAICVMQHILDPDGNSARGASRPVIAAMVGLDEVFADGKILKILGREAAVTFAGSRVYSRHPAIASAVVDHLAAEKEARRIYELVGQAGGALRAAGAGEIDGYLDAYLLSRELPPQQAVWAATGAVKGAGADLLEPRVSLLRALRIEGANRAVTYAYKLGLHTRGYRDYRSAIRAFLVEFSISLRDDGHAQTAAGLAALALDDRVGFTLDERRASFALVSLAKSMSELSTQTGDQAMADGAEICYVLLERIRGKDVASKLLRQLRGKPLVETRRTPSRNLCARLASALQTFATSALAETGIPIDPQKMLYFDSLGRAAGK